MAFMLTNIRFILTAIGIILVTLAASLVRIGVIKTPKAVPSTSCTFWISIVTAILMASISLLTR